jgi:hypothetical protein
MRNRARGVADCACSALGYLTSETYEDAYVAIASVDPTRRGKCGLYNREVVSAAQVMGVTLVVTRTYDLDEDDGILRIKWNGRKGKRLPGGHFVAVRKGQMVEGRRLAWREYLRVNQGRACTLLREVA